MDYHSGIKDIQYSSTAILANLFELNKGLFTSLGLEKQQNILKILIKVMKEHQSDPLLLRHGFRILKWFDFTKIELVNKIFLENYIQGVPH